MNHLKHIIRVFKYYNDWPITINKKKKGKVVLLTVKEQTEMIAN